MLKCSFTVLSVYPVITEEDVYLLDDRDLVVVANGVFAQEVELHHALVALQTIVEGDVLDTQRAAAHRVRRLALLFLVSSSQGELLQSDGSSSLTSTPEGEAPIRLNATNYRDLKSHLVYEVQGHSPLPRHHLLRLEVMEVVVTDAVHTGLQLPSDLVFLPVLLSLRVGSMRRKRGRGDGMKEKTEKGRMGKRRHSE